MHSAQPLPDTIKSEIEEARREIKRLFNRADMLKKIDSRILDLQREIASLESAKECHDPAAP